MKEVELQVVVEDNKLKEKHQNEENHRLLLLLGQEQRQELVDRSFCVD
jgi:hypothetical protein